MVLRFNPGNTKGCSSRDLLQLEFLFVCPWLNAAQGVEAVFLIKKSNPSM
jgi:hypothetical protein